MIQCGDPVGDSSHPRKGWGKEVDFAGWDGMIIWHPSGWYWEPSGRVLMTIQEKRSEVKAEPRKSGGDDVNYRIFVIS